MKLFSKLLLTFTLIASSAFAEPAKELQEELACGILNCNEQDINKALVAGANPFTLHKTEHILHWMKNVLKFEAGMEFVAAIDEVPPYLIIIQSKSQQKNITSSIEALLKFGVSVDREPSAGVENSTRQQIDLDLKEIERVLENRNYTLTTEQKDQYACQAEQLKSVLALMRKYQPEPAGFEYASSFRFVPNVCTECDLEKKAAEIETTLKTYRVLSVYGALACSYMLYGCLKNGYTAGKIGFTEGLTKSFFSHAASSIAHYMNGTVLAFGVLHLINQRQEIWRKLISKIHPH